MAEARIRVLFLCTGNSARSQIAEALLQQKGKERFVAGSAGTHPAPAVHPGAIAALARIGIDWSGRRPKLVDEIIDQPWDMVITVCDNAKESCPFLPGKPAFAHWGMPDPAAIGDPVLREEAFAETVEVLSRRLEHLVATPRTELLAAE